MIGTDLPDTAPTLIVGIGPVGRRVSRFVGERQENSLLHRSGLVQELDGSDEEEVRRAIETLTEHRRVVPAETSVDIRAPAHRFLRLRLLCILSAEDVGSAPLLSCLEKALKQFVAYDHPPEGVQIVIAIDASGKERVTATAPNLAELVRRLPECLGDGSTKFRTTVLIAHRLYFGGSHLSHDGLDDPDRIEADEFETTLGRLIEAFLRPRSESDGPKPGIEYVAVGGASAVFPRELLLYSAAQRIGADVLEEILKPEPKKESQRVCPDRDALFRRVAGEVNDVTGSLVESKEPVRRRSLYDRVFDTDPPRSPQSGVRFQPVAVLGEANTLGLDELAEQFEQIVTDRIEGVRRQLADRLPGTAQRAAESGALAIRGAIDDFVGKELGGVDLATRSLSLTKEALLSELTLEEARIVAKCGLTAPRTKALTPAFVPLRSHRFPQDTDRLLQEFRKGVRKLPALAALCLRALICGAAWHPIGSKLGWGVGGSIILGSSLVLFAGAWVWKRLVLERMRNELLVRMEDAVGEFAYAEIQKSLGATLTEGPSGEPEPVLGALPQLARYLDEWERPLVLGFGTLCATGVRLLRQSRHWPNGYVPEVDFIEQDDPGKLHGLAKYPDQTRMERADERLRAGLFQPWRNPSFPLIEDDLSRDAEIHALVPWIDRPLGEFFAALHRATVGADERSLAQAVVKRMDGLGVSAQPLVPALDEEPQGNARTLLVRVPRSLSWFESCHTLGGSDDRTAGLPEGTRLGELLKWLIPGQRPELDEAERDFADAFLRCTANGDSEIVRWFRSDVVLGWDKRPRHALLVAQSEYPENPLPHAIPEIASLEQCLLDLGFSVTKLENVRLAKLQSAVTAFVKGLPQGAVSFFAFSGHGSEQDGASLLACVDGKSYSLDHMFERISPKQGLNVFALDCCRVVYGGSQNGRRARAPMPPNSIAVFATSEATLAYGTNFMPEFVRALETPDLTIDEVLRRARLQVIDKSKGKQVPSEESTLTERLILRRSGGSA